MSVESDFTKENAAEIAQMVLENLSNPKLIPSLWDEFFREWLSQQQYHDPAHGYIRRYSTTELFRFADYKIE